MIHHLNQDCRPMLVILRSLISSNEVTAVNVLEVYLKIYSNLQLNDETTKIEASLGMPLILSVILL